LCELDYKLLIIRLLLLLSLYEFKYLFFSKQVKDCKFVSKQTLMKKNSLLAIIFCLLSFEISAQSCFPDTLYLTSQEAIDNFSIENPDCTELLGFVLVEEAISGDITNLEGLIQLHSVRRTFIIRNNTALVNLVGLDNIETAGGFSIANNNSLMSLNGLGNLDTIRWETFGLYFGKFSVLNNPSLTNLNGLMSLEYVENSLTVSDGEAFIDFSGLNALKKVESLNVGNCPAFQSFGDLPLLTGNAVDYINISNCNNITEINGLGALRRINSLTLKENANLLSLDGLENLDTLDNLFLESNPLLENIDGLEGLEDLSGSIDIKFNNSITNIAGLQVNNDSLGGITIWQNPLLTSLEGLSNYEVIGSLWIAENDTLAELSGLEGLKEIRVDFEIYSNKVLESFDGLQQLETIRRDFYCNNNTALSSLDGLSGLKKVGGEFWIRNQLNIIDLTGLEQLDTLGHGLQISSMPALQSLDGLDGLEYLGGESDHNGGLSEGRLLLNGNSQLSDISAIAGASVEDLKIISILNNPLLEICGYSNICSYIVSGRQNTIKNNALGCNNKGQVIQDCFNDLDHTSIIGTVTTDINLDCEITNDNPIPNSIIAFSNDSLDWQITADQMGEYWMPLLLGEWTASPISPSSFWTPCVADTTINVTAQGDTIVIDFPLQPMGDCSYIEWDMSYGDLRICDSTTFVLDYCNYGTSIAEDLIITVSLDSFLTFQNSTAPFTIDGDGNIIFLIDDLALFECDQLTFSAFVDCDSLDIWDVQCVEVSLLKVNGYCENDSIHFELENIGDGDMIEPAQFRVEIVIDDIILFLTVDEYQLIANASDTLSFPVGISTGMRIEADQSPGFPGNEQEASAVVANCNAIENNEIYILLPNGEDGDPFNEVFCEPVVNSFDPNDKSAVPEGLTNEHLIDKDWTIDYRIRFQNTGNAQANIVVIRDLLSDNLDINTLEVKGASHPFTWELTVGRELVFTFDNIMLPDSNANEPASHGFVSFAVNPKGTLLPGAEIENIAEIYFDFNEAIITNSVRHKIRKPIVSTSEHQDFCLGGSLMGIPIWSDTTFQFLTEGTLYDSIHFLHLDVASTVNNTVEIEVPVGEVLADVEIQGDTIFIVEYESQFGCDSLVTYNVVGIVGVNDLSEDFDQIVIYPNPTADILNIINNENEVEQTWQLTNSLGQKVWQTKLNIGETLSPIEVGNYCSGIYLLEVKTKKGNGIWKIMIDVVVGAPSSANNHSRSEKTTACCTSLTKAVRSSFPLYGNTNNRFTKPTKFSKFSFL